MSESPNTNRTPGSNKPFVKTLAFSAFRGTLLIAIAIVIGVVLLQVVDNGSSGAVGKSDKAPASTEKKDAATTSSTTTTEKPQEPKSPSELKVLVLNGSKVSGAAGKIGSALTEKSYDILSPADAADVDTGTIVYFKPELALEGAELAAVLSSAIQTLGLKLASPATDEPIPSEMPGTWKGETSQADLIVVLAPKS